MRVQAPELRGISNFCPRSGRARSRMDLKARLPKYIVQGVNSNQEIETMQSIY